MNIKIFFRWLYNKIYTYNVFIPDEDDYEDEDELEQPETLVRHQRYATRLYILLLIGFLYVLFYTALMTRQSRTRVLSSIDLEIYKQLYAEYNDTLSCPCSNTTTPYRDFISNNITFHPVCDSLFVTKSWTEAFYSLNASEYSMINFTKTAHAQFRLLSDLCSFAKESMSQNQLDVDNSELVSLYLLHPSQVQSEIDATVDIFESIVANRINIFLNYLRVATRANYLVSALNTNFWTQASSDYASMWGTIVTYGLWSNIGHNVNLYIPCSTGNPTSSVILYSNLSKTLNPDTSNWKEPNHNSSLVNGFHVGCTPFEALLPSTLDCLYDIDCLQLLSDHIPTIKQMNLDSTSIVLRHAEKSNTSISDFLWKLFVQNRTTTIDYPKYFVRCSPSLCTYTITDETNFSHAIALFIRLYGGLIIILRLVTPFLIKTSIKLTNRTRQNPNANSVSQNKNYISRLIKWMKDLNLFKKSSDRSDKTVKQQRIITRVYLLLLAGSMCILVLFNSFSTRITINNVPNPSLDTYTNLQISHSDSLRCPCTNTNIIYQKFISISPVFHQVCSSDFVTQQWISILSQSHTENLEFDWRNRAFSFFQLLSNICEFANQTVNDAIRRFLVGSFVTSNAMTKVDFDEQISAILNEFFDSTIIYFDLFIKTTRLLMQIDQPLMGSLYQTVTLADPYLTLVPLRNQTFTSETAAIPFGFLLYGTRDINTIEVNCICATNPHCQSPTAIYTIDRTISGNVYLYMKYLVPGFITGCSRFESFLLSTLECFFSNSDCFPALKNDIRERYFFNIEYPSWFEVRSLIYNSSSTQFPPNMSISDIVSKIMIERWNSIVSYEQFYQSCSPSHCSYSNEIRTKTALEIIVSLIPMIGGLSMVLRLITPRLVRLVIKLLIKCGRSRQTQQQVRTKLLDRIKVFLTKMTRRLYRAIIQLNIFPARHFGNKVSQATAKRLGQWTTRLYALLLIITSTIIILYTIVQSQALTKTFHKPSFDSYNHLKQQYKDSLKCSCSSVASLYELFVHIEPQFHEVCSSQFVSNEWRNNLTAGLVANLSIYSQRDYRRFLSAHLQFLQGLCRLSIQSVNSSIEQFLSSLFVTTQLLSQEEFDDRLSSLIDQTKLNTPFTFNRLLSLTRIITDGNAVISTYGTNFGYIQYPDSTFAVTLPIIYDKNCSCGITSNCTTQANIIEENTLKIVSIKGLKMGCTPSESFRLSTLECFYDQTCLDHIQHYLNDSKPIFLLNRTMRRFQENSTIDKLVKGVFVEDWTVSTNYSAYYHQCLPLLCSYTYIERVNILYTITYLIGLFGGMTTVLKWISPQIVRFVFKISQYRKRRTSPVQVVSTVEISSDEVQETNTSSSMRYSSKYLICCTVIILVMIIVVIFSIFIVRHKKEQKIATVLSTLTANITMINSTITITSTITTSIATTLSLCQPTFQLISTYPIIYFDSYAYPLVADFNNDQRPDIVFYSEFHYSIIAFMGLGDGSFQEELMFTPLNAILVNAIDYDDFNGDNYLDLAVLCTEERYVFILLGNGDGTFEVTTTFQTKLSSFDSYLTVSDLNNDNQSDIIVLAYSYNYVTLFLGNGDGTFRKHLVLDTGLGSDLASPTLGDFNNDNHIDIAVVNEDARNIGVFLGYNNGSFESQITSFTGGGLDPKYVAVGDLNSDGYLDVVISYDMRCSVGIMFGYGNGSFGNIMKFCTEVEWIEFPTVVVDYNGDNHLDIVFYRDDLNTIDVLLGDGKGHFQRQILYIVGFQYMKSPPLVGDFNNDGYQDIIIFLGDPSSFNVLMNTCGCCTIQ